MDTECSTSLSGFGTYTKDILTRLHDSGKFEIAELASYGKLSDPAVKNIPWKFYANEVLEGDPRIGQYRAEIQNQFGKWRFESVLLDFKPDIVWNIRDYWMMAHNHMSPLRPYYHLVWMPTVDSEPQQDDWMDGIINADAVFSYTDWGADVLRKQGGDIINVKGSAPYGLDMHRYKPTLNKKEHKRRLGFQEDALIIGTVMRNQKRKLYPDLMKAFKIYLEKCKSEGKTELANRSYLYMHTSYPDMQGSWHFPKLLKEHGLGYKVLFTYICHHCHMPFASFMQDAKNVCPNCNSTAAGMPNVGKGLTIDQLIDVYNIFDVYIQYASREGFGMPQVEAAACGVPVVATDYTAMKDVVRKVNGYPIPILAEVRAPEEDSYCGVPDNNYCANVFYKLLSMSDSERREKGLQARAGVEKYYQWERVAKIWSDYFENAELTGLQGKWDSPPNFKNPNLPQIPEGLSNSDFVDWCMVNILGDEKKLNSYFALEMLRSLNFGMVVAPGYRPEPFDRNSMLRRLQLMVNNHNICEQSRCGYVPLQQEDYLAFANRKRK